MLSKPAPPAPADDPIAWFAELALARRRDDFERAAKAQRQLQKLGVIVTFSRDVAKGGARDVTK